MKLSNINFKSFFVWSIYLYSAYLFFPSMSKNFIFFIIKFFLYIGFQSLNYLFINWFIDTIIKYYYILVKGYYVQKDKQFVNVHQNVKGNDLIYKIIRIYLYSIKTYKKHLYFIFIFMKRNPLGTIFIVGIMLIYGLVILFL